MLDIINDVPVVVWRLESEKTLQCSIPVSTILLLLKESRTEAEFRRMFWQEAKIDCSRMSRMPKAKAAAA